MRPSCPDGFLVYSDGHSEPGMAIAPAAVDAANAARRHHIPLILNGDMLDLIIWGWRTYRGTQALNMLRSLTQGIETYYVLGNHEGRAAWVQQLFRKQANVGVVESLDIDVNGVLWRVEHGERFALDWQ